MSKSKSQPKEDKPVVITVTVLPLKNGKRRIMVSGAPEGEMPLVARGVFADLHKLIGQMWLAIQTREPQVVTVKAAKAKNDKAEPEGESGAEQTGDDPSDQLVTSGGAAQGGLAAAAPAPPAELPAIEGDFQPALLTV